MLRVGGRVIVRGRFALRGLPASCRLLSSKAYSHEKEREFLLQFNGGSIDMTKDDDTGIATVVLNNPDKKNAFSGKMMVDFADIVTDLEHWSSGRGIFLYGSNHTFCSGGDLGFMKDIIEPEEGENMSRYMSDILMRLFHLPLVSLALVEGRALGGGAEISCACDFRAFSSSAVVGFVQTKLAVSPGWGGGARLVEIVGRTKALRLLASGTLVTSAEAKAIGFADAVVPDGDSALEEGMTFLRSVTVGCPKATQAAKKVIVNASALDLRKATNAESQIFRSVWGSKEHLKSLSSDMKFTKTKPN